MNVFNLIRNNFSRILAKKEILIVAVIVVPIIIGIAVFFSSKMHMKPHIALVTSESVKLPESDKVKVDIVKNKPAMSSLMLGRYAAIVEYKENGEYEITAKNNGTKVALANYFKTGKLKTGNENEKRGTGTNVLGFILMIVLAQGVSLTLLYPEDRSLKTFKRILLSYANERQYILAQGILAFLCIYVPTYIVLVITKVCFGVDIGFDFGILALLIAILSALSTSLGLFFSSLLERDVSVTASSIYIITSILAGCFYSFTDNSKILNAICKALPQKAYMSLSQGLESGKGLLEYKGQLIYLFIWIIGMWLIGSIVTGRRMKKGTF